MKRLYPTVRSGAARSTAGSHVALVDDDPHILQALSNWLVMLGITPRTFGSAEALLEDLRRPESTLPAELAGAILDISLGGMDGVALARQLRTTFPNLPIVMISALNADEIRQLGPLPARSACLKKPFDLDALEDALFASAH